MVESTMQHFQHHFHVLAINATHGHFAGLLWLSSGAGGPLSDAQPTS